MSASPIFLAVVAARIAGRTTFPCRCHRPSRLLLLVLVSLLLPSPSLSRLFSSPRLPLQYPSLFRCPALSSPSLSRDLLSFSILYCNEIHVGATGHPFKTCRGLRADHRKGLHEWTTATVEDVLIPIETYHLSDRLGKRISHEERFSIPRIPAVVELCVQAGVDLPGFPTKRRRKPVIRLGRSEIIDANEDDLPDPRPSKFKKPILDEVPDCEIVLPANAEETASLSEATLEAWETLWQGAAKLMRKYPVRVCGYCPEVHVGPSGHKAQNCGAYKHQQRNGQHGWQSATLDDLIPPRYVWHVPETALELQRELRNFYGQAPAVVELCVQGGAAVPEFYKPTMRLDVGIPTNLREAEMVV
ncbi:hypothetical protein BHE74_00046709 [Ensete ventricosum]|nr:hypothetical protein BHE74_00046709 [Ensete ventricosum]